MAIINGCQSCCPGFLLCSSVVFPQTTCTVCGIYLCTTVSFPYPETSSKTDRLTVKHSVLASVPSNHFTFQSVHKTEHTFPPGNILVCTKPHISLVAVSSLDNQFFFSKFPPSVELEEAHSTRISASSPPPRAKNRSPSLTSPRKDTISESHAVQIFSPAESRRCFHDFTQSWVDSIRCGLCCGEKGLHQDHY